MAARDLLGSRLRLSKSVLARWEGCDRFAVGKLTIVRQVRIHGIVILSCASAHAVIEPCHSSVGHRINNVLVGPTISTSVQTEPQGIICIRIHDAVSSLSMANVFGCYLLARKENDRSDHTYMTNGSQTNKLVVWNRFWSEVSERPGEPLTGLPP